MVDGLVAAVLRLSAIKIEVCNLNNVYLSDKEMKLQYV